MSEKANTCFDRKQDISKKDRIRYIDIARGIAIILMIAGHVLTLNDWKRKVIFTFHMPLFIIVSGMFFKEGESFKRVIIKTIKKLIIPYVVTIIITHILNVIINSVSINIIDIVKQILLAYSNKKTFFKEVQTVGVLWFLPFLALCKIIFYWINRVSKNDDIMKGIICFVITTIGVYLSKVEIFLPWSLDIALASTIFYYIGYIFKKYNIIEKIFKNYKIIICFMILWVIGLKLGHIELATRLYPSGLTCFITAISGTIICFFVSNIIVNIPKYNSNMLGKLLSVTEKVCKYISNILQWFGKNSMYILCFHYLELALVQYDKLGIEGNFKTFIVKIIIITILTFIATKLMNFIEVLKEKRVNEKI